LFELVGLGQAHGACTGSEHRACCDLRK
jgi:hypothetical protein